MGECGEEEDMSLGRGIDVDSREEVSQEGDVLGRICKKRVRRGVSYTSKVNDATGQRVVVE